MSDAEGRATMTVDFAVTPQSDDGLLVVEVSGEVDLFTAPDLKSAITDGIDAGSEKVVVDLSRTTFLDSTALGVLIGAVKRLRANGGSLTIVNTDENIAKTFEITGLDQIFSIHKTRDAAVAAL